MITSGHSLPGVREAAQLLLPETLALWSQMLPLTDFLASGQGYSGCRSPLCPAQGDLLLLEKLFFLLFCIYSTVCIIFIGYAFVLYVLY